MIYDSFTAEPPLFRGEFFMGVPIVVCRHLVAFSFAREVIDYAAANVDWGHGVTPGAKQLALALLVYVSTREAAVAAHHAFADTVIASLGSKWTLTETEIVSFVHSFNAQRNLFE
jgi:hypothetical protein